MKGKIYTLKIHTKSNNQILNVTENELIIEETCLQEEKLSRTSSRPALPHNWSICQRENNNSIDSDDIPDMNIILTKFGIDASRLNLVPLEKYDWQKFEFYKAIPHSPNKGDEFDVSVTISQRIKTLSRKARIIRK